MKLKGAANIFDFSDAGLDQLDGAKAVQDLIFEGITIEGRLIDEDRAIAIEIPKPDPSVNGDSALRQP
jgi:hypothetical protein